MTERTDKMKKTGAHDGASRSSAAQKKGSVRSTGHVFLSGLKNFGIVFVICIVIFGLLASLAVSFVTSAVDDFFDEKSQLEEILNKDSEKTSAQTDDTPLPDGESFTALVAVTDFDPVHFTYYPQGKALSRLRLHMNDRDMGILGAGYKTVGVKMTVLVRCDRDRREYTVTPVSTHTRVFTPAGYMQLGDVYCTFGAQYLVDKVTAITGIGVDYYFFLNALEAPKIAAALGQYNVELAKDIYSDGAVFGTEDKAYGDVTTVIPPEPEETTADPDDTGDGTADGTDTEPEPETTAPPETTEEPEDTEEDPAARGEYERVVSKGTVTVKPDNLQALLMFDDYENGVEERLHLEYQLVRGALLQLASMTEEERTEFYEKVLSETPIIDCSIVYEEKDEDDKDKDKKDGEKKDDGVDLADHGFFDDGKINTDMSSKTAQLKGDLIAAALRFTVRELGFTGRYVNGYFAADLTDNASQFMQYKLPADPEKIVTVKS